MGRVIRWRRWMFRRLLRMQGTAHSVALGMGFGVFMSFLMPPGLQLITALPLALLIRANLIATTAGTMVTNPFTYIPAYYFTCRVGELFLQLLGFHPEL